MDIVSQHMSTALHTVGPDVTLDLADELMRANDIHHLPVVDSTTKYYRGCSCPR